MNTMNKFLFTLLLWGVIGLSYTYSQTITITNSETKEPLAYVTIHSQNPLASATTNVMGQADIRAFKNAERIEIRTVGFKMVRKSYSELANSSWRLALVPSQIDLDQVVVSATKWSQPKRETPHKITTITSKEIALQQPQTTADLLGGSGEVFIQKSQQGGGSPMIRGFATNRLLMAVDGIRMNTAIFRSGNLQNVISLNPYTIQQTEVFFGPGSVIYGSDAIGGVMNFYTLQPQLSTTNNPLITGKAATRYSSANNELATHADANIGWKRWSLLTSFTHNRYGDLEMGSTGPDEYLRKEYVERVNGQDVIVQNDNPKLQKQSGFTQNHFMGKLRFQPNQAWNFTYAFHYSATSNYDRYDRLIRYRDGLPRSAEWYYGPQIWMMNQLSIEHQKPTVAYDQFTIRLAQQHFEESRHDRDFGDSLRNNRTEEVEAYSINLDFVKTLSLKHQVLYGAEVVTNKVTSRGEVEDIVLNRSSTGAARYPDATWNSYGVFATYRFKPTTKWTLEAGARYNSFGIDATFDTQFYPLPFETADLSNGAITGSVGADYNPTETWSVSANLATGFRSPNVDDMGKIFDSEPGAVVVPNPDLEAEYAYSAEIDIAKVFGNFLKVDIAAYYTLLDQALVRRDFQLNDADSIVYDGEMSKVQAIQNAANASVYGIQAGVEVKLPEGFILHSQFNWQEGEEELDDGSTSPSRHATPWFGVTRLGYQHQKFTLEFNVQYSGEVPFEDMPESEVAKDYLYAIDDQGNPYSPGWYTLNLKTMIPITKQLVITGGIENLLDKRYRPFSSGLVASGRNVVLALTAKF
jgi:hemoglobin/transferrin/lactoferrin receptor protein